MAITQQCARVPAGVLQACRRSTEAVDRLCSFRAVPRSDYLDLDWAGAMLVRVFELAGVDDVSVVALRLALTSRDELTPEYRDHLAVVWDPPMVITPEVVVEVAGGLSAVDFDAVVAVLPVDAEGAGQMLGVDFDGHPRGYLTGHFAALCDFYAGAAQRGLAIVTWDD
ncbi:hypothetical protein [Tsukamurella soli]|uniref:DUF1877 domain-containing protein n=1 Tax=Tsukamurella soli TaxID=644556 RepID=A0ABP8JS79_9ACTN